MANALGVYFFGSPSNYKDYLATRPVMVKLMDFDSVQDLRMILGYGIQRIAYRHYVGEEPQGTLYKRWTPERWLAGFPLDKWQVFTAEERQHIWLEPPNEPEVKDGADADYINDWNVHWADVVRPTGFRCYAYNFSTQHPAIALLPKMKGGAVACGRAAKHAYWRPQRGFADLEEVEAYLQWGVPIDITELGVDRGGGYNDGWRAQFGYK